MKKIKTSESNFYDMCDTFDYMSIKADDYTPTATELKYMTDDLGKYMSFLVWINDTGYTTEENQAVRLAIRRIINENLIIEQ